MSEQVMWERPQRQPGAASRGFNLHLGTNQCHLQTLKEIMNGNANYKLLGLSKK